MHVAKGPSFQSTAGTVQGVANLILLGVQLVGMFSAGSSDVCPPSDAVVGAVVAQGRVWTLRQSGTLCSLAQGENTPRAEALPEQEQPLALCSRNGTVAVLTAKGETEGGWTLRQLDDGAWRLQSSFDTGPDHFVALDCAFEQVTLLTSRHIFVAQGGAMRAVLLSAEVPPGWISLQVHGGEADVTVDNEAGRALLRIDLQDGAVTSEGGGPAEDGSVNLPSSQVAPQF